MEYFNRFPHSTRMWEYQGIHGILSIAHNTIIDFKNVIYYLIINIASEIRRTHCICVKLYINVCGHLSMRDSVLFVTTLAQPSFDVMILLSMETRIVFSSHKQITSTKLDTKALPTKLSRKGLMIG